MSKQPRSRYQIYRDSLRGGPPRKLAPHGTYARARKHQRDGEPLCRRCVTALKLHNDEMNARRREQRSR